MLAIKAVKFKEIGEATSPFKNHILTTYDLLIKIAIFCFY